MSRGQLTYYFPAKEEILLAVFDCFLKRMQDGFQEKGGVGGLDSLKGWELAQWIMGRVIQGNHWEKDFYNLKYTFLSQIHHRPDFKEKLSGLYEEWRGKMTTCLEEGFPEARSKEDFRDLATLIQAILHGLAIQKSADQNAFDPGRLFNLATRILLEYLQPPLPKPLRNKSKNAKPMTKRKTSKRGNTNVHKDA
ncbi:MAG: hypothetical protein EXR99_08245 [Gemmataceae bacterium]|nr:hypothetical protein [Gemmataceae bacterium]